MALFKLKFKNSQTVFQTVYWSVNTSHLLCELHANSQASVGNPFLSVSVLSVERQNAAALVRQQYFGMSVNLIMIWAKFISTKGHLKRVFPPKKFALASTHPVQFFLSLIDKCIISIVKGWKKFVRVICMRPFFFPAFVDNNLG